MEIFALSLKIKEEGAAAVKAATDKLRESLKGVGKDSTTAGEESSKGFKRMEMAALAAGAAIGVALLGAMRKTIDASRTHQFAQAQLASALQSTGNVARQSVDALNAHAAALQRVSNFGDEAINGAQALLLTFTQIQGDTFPKATEAVLNVATAMGTDLKSAAIQVGKALNDPILGVTALARSGIQFTVTQKEMIASLVASGRQVEAQALILKDLESQFGGSAAAARNTLGGALISLKNAFGDLFEVSADGAKPAIQAIEGLTKVVQGVGAAFAYATPLAIAFAGALTAANFPLIVSTVGMVGRAVFALVPALMAAVKGQLALNTAMLLNPAGALIAAVTALAAGLSLYTIALDKATEAREKESATNPAYLAALEEIRKRRAALTAEQERGNRVDAAAGSRQEELVKLAGLTRLTASELRELQGAERGYAAALQVSGLPLADRITALERLKSLQDAIATQVLTPQTMAPSTTLAPRPVRAPAIAPPPRLEFAAPTPVTKAALDAARKQVEDAETLVRRAAAIGHSAADITKFQQAAAKARAELQTMLRRGVVTVTPQVELQVPPDGVVVPPIDVQLPNDGKLTPSITVTPQVDLRLPPSGLFDPAVMAKAKAAVEESAAQLRDMLAQGISNSIGDGIAAGFERGFATGKMGEGFKALAGTMLSGLGSAMIQFGQAGLAAALLMDGFLKNLSNMIPGGAVAKAVAMIALGGTLKGVAQASFGGGGGNRVTPVTAFGATMGGMQSDGNVTRLVFGQTSATTAAGMTPRSATNVTIIGPDDPKAQRAIQELISKGQTRGTLG